MNIEIGEEVIIDGDDKPKKLLEQQFLNKRLFVLDMEVNKHANNKVLYKLMTTDGDWFLYDGDKIKLRYPQRKTPVKESIYDKTLVSIELEFDTKSETGIYGDTLQKKAYELADIDLIYSYNDGSVNSEWVTSPISLTQPEKLDNMLKYVSYVISRINDGSRAQNSGCHTTFQLDKNRLVSFKESRILVGEVVKQHYPALIWLSTTANATRGVYFRQWGLSRDDYKSKNGYPGVVFPHRKDYSHALNCELPTRNKIEFRIPDTFYHCPEWEAVLIDIYHAIIKAPTYFIQKQEIYPANIIQDFRYMMAKTFQTEKFVAFEKLSALEQNIMTRYNLNFLLILLSSKVRRLLKERTVKTLENILKNYSISADKKNYLTFKFEINGEEKTKLNKFLVYCEEVIDNDEEQPCCDICNNTIRDENAYYVGERCFCSEDCLNDAGYLLTTCCSTPVAEDDAIIPVIAEQDANGNIITESLEFAFCSPRCARANGYLLVSSINNDLAFENWYQNSDVFMSPSGILYHTLDTFDRWKHDFLDYESQNFSASELVDFFETGTLNRRKDFSIIQKEIAYRYFVKYGAKLTANKMFSLADRTMYQLMVADLFGENVFNNTDNMTQCEFRCA